ncbi:autotransporter outer membrane beta-barrel domain-containing protein [Paraurantiacibacter namhicola]|uniref:Autotransporter beta-domain protein n=1 Tax=Paraurantiacibacter namhicola TaxID=645517 RepID=A0A1C7D7H9_9SPHN|nr:autotransporter outer membrane beta-barrel domain-containing protein [Paraurantiacibacter namhicola]ANU07434.1 Autotransporter beta-domain protein [Paraurantiacibacter namhicola]
MRKSLLLASAIGVGACLLPGTPARAAVITDTSPTLIVSDPGSFSPVCEVFSASPAILATDPDLLSSLDVIYMGVTDASGTVGLNNIGQPNPQQIRSISVGQSLGYVGFIDRTATYSPKYLTVWEGVPVSGSPGTFQPGAVLIRILIPDSLIPASCKPPTNQAPTADAGADVANVVPGSTVTLDGSASTDPDNDALTYSWVQVSGPAVTLTNANSATPSFTAPGGAGGTPIVFQLVVNDGTVSSVADTVTISIQDNIATASAQIGGFLAQRNTVLLSHQPDLQRRIDRLEGRSRSGGLAVGGVMLPGSDKLPLSGTIGAGALAVSAGMTAAGATRQDGVSGSWDIWGELYASTFDFSGAGGNATVIYGGVDYAVSPGLLVGVMGQYDDIGMDKAVTTGVLGGEGWMAGPYITARLAPDLFLDARAAWGQSANTISPFGTYTDTFDTDRLLLAGTLTGNYDLATGLVLRPEAAVHWLQEDAKSYTDSLGSTIPGLKSDLGQLSFAPRLMYRLPVDDRTDARPWVEARGIYAWGDQPTAFGGDDLRLRLEGGVDLLTEGGIRASLSGFHDGIGISGYSASGVHLRLGVTF